MRHTGPYEQCDGAWKELCDWACPKGLFGPQTQVLGVGYDDPEITPPEKIRYDACISVGPDVEGEGSVGIREIEGGEYVTAIWKGPYTGLMNVYAALCGQWGPSSGREFSGKPCVEQYLNDPATTKPEDLLTEIRIPLV
ncbi:AraC family transcriptional regulator [Oleidesulfovibrio sp.]|uniref:AraC family transcriptional regulator n=1 Tax=Oleidesulfovibrio sp. TaxID=2909707 RepID=UPI003A89A55C